MPILPLGQRNEYDQKNELNRPIHFNQNEYICPFENNSFSGEIFLRINDYIPEAGFDDSIFISNYGKIYNAKKNVVYEKNAYYKLGDTDRYTAISNNERKYPLHRIMVSCFYENNLFNKELQPDHINGIKNDNRINLFNPKENNLEWVSRSENITRAYNIGLSKIGEDNVHSKISEDTARKVIELLATNKYKSQEIKDIINDPNLTIHIIDDIRKKKNWARLSEGCEFHQRIHRQFTEEDVHHFCQVFQDLKQQGSTLGINDRCREALIRNGFSPDTRYVETLRKIFVKKYYPHIISQYNF